MEKVQTGIAGFDVLVKGGFPQGKIVLLSGTPGTGKTIFAIQYIYNGATMFNEKGLYISFEEKIDSLRNQARQFGWDLPALEKKGMIKLLHIPPSEIKDSTPKQILKLMERHKMKRLVIDSLSALSINVPLTHAKVTEITSYAIQRYMYHFINELRNLKSVTTLVISQTTDGQLSRDTVSEFVCDGILLLTYQSLGGDYSRALRVRKMREVKQNEDVHPVEISARGLIVHDLD